MLPFLAAWLCAAALLLPGARVLVSAAAGWDIIHPQTPKSFGTHTHPSIRYGHSLLPYKGNIILSHGYYYDREAGAATWLSDTWAMSAAAPYKWRILSGHLHQETAHTAYLKGTVPKAPCGRFGTASATVGGFMYLYGGHDGGTSRHNRSNYEPGFDFEELWRFDLHKFTWAFVETVPGQRSPGKRYLAAMTAVGDSLMLYGGMQEGQGDVWAYNTARDTWIWLSAEKHAFENGPGRRVGHAMVPWTDAGGPKGFLMQGGRSIDPKNSSLFTLHNDAWFFDLDAANWRKLEVVGGEAAAPPARKYHALMHTYLKVDGASSMHVGIVAGGTLTSPGLKCTADAWAFAVDCGTTKIMWQRLPDLPAELYDLRGAAWDTSAFVFGGHLCAIDDAQKHPYYYVNEVSKLSLDPSKFEGLAQLASHGCKLPSSSLPSLEVEKLTPGGEDDEL